jgi:hypothetical protein
MPRGSPKPVIAVRIDRTKVEEVKRYTDDFTAAVDEGLTLWLKRKRRAPAAASEPKPQPRETA